MLIPRLRYLRGAYVHEGGQPGVSTETQVPSYPGHNTKRNTDHEQELEGVVVILAGMWALPP